MLLTLLNVVHFYAISTCLGLRIPRVVSGAMCRPHLKRVSTEHTVLSAFRHGSHTGTTGFRHAQLKFVQNTQIYKLLVGK